MDAQPATRRRFTAVLVSSGVRENLRVVLQELTRTPEVAEVIVWMHDPERSFAFPGVTVIDAPPRSGGHARYCGALLAQQDDLWLQADDLALAPEQFQALARAYDADPARIVGCRGHRLRDGRYVPEEAYGEVDIVQGRTMMFHRRLLPLAFAALSEVPPPAEDDVAFSLCCGRKHLAVDVGPLRDLGTPRDPTPRRGACGRDARQATVEACIHWLETSARSPVRERKLLGEARRWRARYEALRGWMDPAPASGSEA